MKDELNFDSIDECVPILESPGQFKTIYLLQQASEESFFTGIEKDDTIYPAQAKLFDNYKRAKILKDFLKEFYNLDYNIISDRYDNLIKAGQELIKSPYFIKINNKYLKVTLTEIENKEDASKFSPNIVDFLLNIIKDFGYKNSLISKERVYHYSQKI